MSMVELPGGGCATESEALSALAREAKRRGVSYGHLVASTTERVTASGKVIHFQSRKEARRYDELMVMLNAGKIRDLRLQVDFTLQEAYTDSEGNRVRAIRYRADFSYKKRPTYWTGYEQQCPDDGWILVVEDVKSRATRTKEYVVKRKLMKERFNIDIQEV